MTVNKKHQCEKEMLQYKPKSSLDLPTLDKMVTPELKKCTKIKKSIWTKVASDFRKNGNSTNFFESASLQWENDSNYNFSKKALGKMQVANDSAERAILLTKPITINQP